jgi:hypothetical protein
MSPDLALFDRRVVTTAGCDPKPIALACARIAMQQFYAMNVEN